VPELGQRLQRLVRGQPAEILARISADDPLRVLELGASRLRETFFLIEPERLQERALARVAVIGARARPVELGAPWLLEQVDHAIHRIIDEDREEELARPFDCDPEDPRFYFLRSGYIVKPRFARAAALAFNALPERPRKGFFRLLIERLPVADCLALGWEPEELRRDVWRCLGALGYPDAQGRPDPGWYDRNRDKKRKA
jgi:hypothetical protein